MIREDSGKNAQKYLEIRCSMRLSYVRLFRDYPQCNGMPQIRTAFGRIQSCNRREAFLSSSQKPSG